MSLQQYLTENHLTTEEEIKLRLDYLSSDELLQIAQDCETIIKNVAIKKKAPSLFNFSASNGLCGAGMNCSGHVCRTREALQLSALAALYGERVTIPNFIKKNQKSFERYSGRAELEQYRYILSGDLQVLAIYAPLIDEGYLVFNDTEIAHCVRCMARTTPQGLRDPRLKKGPELQKFAEDFLVDNLMFEFDGEKIFYKDPSGYTDLDAHLVTLKKRHPLVGTQARTLTPEEVRKVKLAQTLAGKMVDDVLQQNIGQELSGATFLTARKLDSILLDRLNGNGADSQTNPRWLSQNMRHELPVVFNGNYTAIIGVRKQEEIAFQEYRNALEVILGQLGPNPTADDVKLALNSEVKPRLLKIEKILEVNKDRMKGNATRDTVITGTLLAVGLAASAELKLEPSAIAGLAAIPFMSGIPAVKAAVDARKVPKEAKQDKYYFLWSKHQSD